MMKYKYLLFFIIPLSAVADEVFVSNITNGCSGNFNSDTSLIATFTRSQYQCDSGYCLPANTDHCVICPEFYDCVGGTFTFNETMNQGQKLKTQINSNITNGCRADFLRAYNNSANITATFTPNTHTCSAGQYLPAGVDACTQCPANSYCVGGTYSFNENINQGIANCDNGYHSSAGASSCEPNIIQITWQGAELEDVLANHAETCTYGGDVRTPVKAIHIPGMTFVGWTVAPQQ